MPGITEEIFLKLLETDFDEVEKEGKKIFRQLEGKDKIEISTPAGTSITFSIKGRELHGLNSTSNGFVRNLPFGEIYCAPLEDSAEGTIAIDYFGGSIVPSDRAQLKVSAGKIVQWNRAAAPFIELQQAANGLVLAEFGIGTNKWHKKPVGVILHDEKIFGSVHLAFGNNFSFGGKNKSPVHNDVVLLDPTVLVDGKRLEW